MLRQDGDEDVLPLHGVEEKVGGLHTSREPGHTPRRDDDPPLVQHGGKDGHHVVHVYSIVVLQEVALWVGGTEWRLDCGTERQK